MVVDMVKVIEPVYVVEYKTENGWRKYPKLVPISKSLDDIIRRKINDWKEIRIVRKYLVTIKDCDRRVVKMYLTDELEY